MGLFIVQYVQAVYIGLTAEKSLSIYSTFNFYHQLTAERDSNRAPQVRKQTATRCPYITSEEYIYIYGQINQLHIFIVAPCPSVEQRSPNASHCSTVDTSWPAPPLQAPNFFWGPHEGVEFCTLVDMAYEEVVHWRRNIFQVPSGSAGKSFVLELARLFQAYADSSSLECIAMKAITIAQVLLLQKPSRSSKSKTTLLTFKGD